MQQEVRRQEKQVQQAVSLGQMQVRSVLLLREQVLWQMPRVPSGVQRLAVELAPQPRAGSPALARWRAMKRCREVCTVIHVEAKVTARVHRPTSLSLVHRAKSKRRTDLAMMMCGVRIRILGVVVVMVVRRRVLAAKEGVGGWTASVTSSATADLLNLHSVRLTDGIATAGILG